MQLVQIFSNQNGNCIKRVSKIMQLVSRDQGHEHYLI